MATAENKTKENDGDVAAFIGSVEHEGRRRDALELLDMFKNITGDEPKMWGDSIIGFGSYHYKYESGREGDMCRSGFSPRKQNLSLYVLGCTSEKENKAKQAELLEKLGPHKRGSSCLYVTRLDRIDRDALAELIAFDKQAMDKKYPR
ncbi:hypothetical protein GCM10009096_10110 [Parasphingorhabdus litoris]|uniref:YdhG-like domain-containing protein n=1 Tax=Parasphingorhabdus litoris TaxID=394733 RepID=A0ABN1A9S8_9SPHN|nr:DUF1801 domain-containing protein [Parasphingorhabdus litoris]